ncbi:MAG: hypothetical protein ACOCZQ_01955 [Nanoarchaeota archaeon]
MFKKLEEFIRRDNVENKTFETFSRLSKENSMPRYKAMPNKEESTSNEEE